MAEEILDIVVIGAGLSGINAAHRLQTELPHLSYTILESRERIGGTWDFWKYPGARTDSSMAMFGLYWFPWRRRENMAAAADLRQYIEDAAAFEGIDQKIRLRHRVVEARWRSDEELWTVLVDATNPTDGSVERKTIKAWWLIGASGYYNYEKPMDTVIPGLNTFGGQVVHPQFWNDSIDYTGKKVIIIGSGATAITLLPAMAETTEHITMLQRSPSYIFSLPRNNHPYFWANFLPTRWTDKFNWWAGMMVETLFVGVLSYFPEFGRNFIRGEIKKKIPATIDMDTHFNPRYSPFQQRLCFCPSGDFFKTLRRPDVDIVTDTIETVTPTGIRLSSGRTLDADMIITATGLHVELLSNMELYVDDARVDTTLGERFAWNNCMIEGVPNAAVLMGYVATSWTPGADVRTQQVIKVIKHMERTGATSMTPTVDGGETGRAKLPRLPAMPLTSTYAVTAKDRLPMVASVGPWRVGENWVADTWNLLFGTITKGVRYTYGKRKGD